LDNNTNVTKPYVNIEENSQYIIREFSQEIDSRELVWHRDKENRLVVPLENTDWKVQLDNQLPVLLTTPIFIKKSQWHRVLKGTGMLKVKIYKL